MYSSAEVYTVRIPGFRIWGASSSWNSEYGKIAHFSKQFLIIADVTSFQALCKSCDYLSTYWIVKRNFDLSFTGKKYTNPEQK